jgi:hypothetical protein
MSEAVEPRKSYAPAEPGLLDEVERRIILLLGGKRREKGQDLEGFPVRHIFTPGLYARELTIPKGGVLTSEIHKWEHPFVVSQGCLTVYGDGVDPVTIHAPYIGITMPGTRRIGFAHEDTIWTTFHVTEETDLVALETELYEDYVNPLLGPARDQRSYIEFLGQFGLSEPEVREISESIDDQIAVDDHRVEVQPSPIEGLGLFARKQILKGERFTARTRDGMRTPAGRYTNHAAQPNCTMCADGGELVLVTDIELDSGVELTVDYSKALSLNLQVTPRMEIP